MCLHNEFWQWSTPLFSLNTAYFDVKLGLLLGGKGDWENKYVILSEFFSSNLPSFKPYIALTAVKFGTKAHCDGEK